MPIPLYEITFDTGHGYIDPKSSLETPRWKDVPAERIRRLKVNLPSGDSLILEEYEAYNLFIEARTAIYGASGTRIEALFVMGERAGEVTLFRISIPSNGSVVGDIRVRRYPKGKEYDNKPTTGWRAGVNGTTA